MTRQRSCPSCGAEGMRTFYEVSGVPFETSVVLSDGNAAASFPCGDISLAICAQCGLISNQAHPGSVQVPTTDYEDQQGFSPTFTKFARGLAADLASRYKLGGKTVVEIGCGKGDFLSVLCAAADCWCVGIDPLFDGTRVANSERITAVAELYSREHAVLAPDLIVCRHTLEHIPDTGEFLRTVRATLDPDRDTAVAMEVPDVTRILDEDAFWDVYFEHATYFSPGSLARSFRGAGFEVIDIQRVYNDQYLIVHARAARPQETAALEMEEDPRVLSAAADEFSARVSRAVGEWRGRIEHRAGRVAVWGSGSKCVAFLSTLGLSDKIGAVVDINPHRQGRFIPGVARPVESPASLVDMRPELVVAMNPVYRDEIAASLSAMGLDTELVAV